MTPSKYLAPREDIDVGLEQRRPSGAERAVMLLLLLFLGPRCLRPFCAVDSGLSAAEARMCRTVTVGAAKVYDYYNLIRMNVTIFFFSPRTVHRSN
jgi:hypothetical protein